MRIDDRKEKREKNKEQREIKTIARSAISFALNSVEIKNKKVTPCLKERERFTHKVLLKKEYHF